MSNADKNESPLKDHIIKFLRKSPKTLNEFRVKLWYQAIRCRGNWSDYDLDMAFGQPINEKRSGTDRIRTFERIRKNLCFPSKGTHSNPPHSIVDRVEENEIFTGTKEIIHSLFWNTLKQMPTSLHEAQLDVQRYLVRYELTRLTDQEAIKWRAQSNLKEQSPKFYSKKNGNLSEYEYWLFKSTDDIPLSLDLIGLYAALYREACLSFRPKYAEMLGDQFSMLIELLGWEDWMLPNKYFFEDLVQGRILYGISDYWPGDRDQDFNKKVKIQCLIIKSNLTDTLKIR